MQKNPILIIDDDVEELELIEEIVKHLGIDRPVKYFTNGNDLEEYLLNGPTAPFLIICDVNLPGESGFDLKKRLADNPELKYKSVPFIFWSNGASERQIQYAYDLPVQGFFFKPNNFTDLQETFKTIMEYWLKSQHPKKVL